MTNKEHSFQESFEEENITHNYSECNNANSKSEEDEVEDYLSQNEFGNDYCTSNDENDNNEINYLDNNREIHEDDNSDSEESKNYDEYQEHIQV